MSVAGFRKFYTVIDRLRTVVIIAIFAFIITVGAVQIFMRYMPGINPMSWVDEIMRYLNIWLVLLAASVGVKHGTHLRMDYLLYRYVPEKGIKVVRLVTELAMIASLILLVYFGFLRVVDNRYTVIQSLRLSIAWFYAAIPVGGIFLLFEYLLIFIHGKHPYTPANVCTDFSDI
jgi:TRAP-type transport system small permease protein